MSKTASMKYSLQWPSLRINKTMTSIRAAKTSGSRSASKGAKNGVVFADENNSVDKIKITIIQSMTGAQLMIMALQVLNLRGFMAIGYTIGYSDLEIWFMRKAQHCEA